MAPATVGTVLVVDDDAAIRETLCMILEDEGYGVATAADGQEALTHLRSSPKPCLILLDLMMPVMSGWDFRKQQQQDPDLAAIPIVVVSAVGNSVERMSALNAIAHFKKPVDLDALLETVAHHCRMEA
jgi:CheY-like chemotaxis protein